MAIYHKWKCIFVHIPKTAGTSVHHRLSNRTDRDDCHRSFIELLNENDTELFESYYSFSVIRNPYDRFISAFEFTRKTTGELDANTDFTKFVESIAGSSSSFYSNLPFSFMPQYKFITIKNVILVDQLIRFENLEKDWNEISQKLNEFKIKRHDSVEVDSYCTISNKLEHLMPSQRDSDFKKYFSNQKTKDIIYNLYRKDFEFFGYKKMTD